MLIVKKTLSEQIYDSLRMDLINRKIPLGSKLINQELQLKFGVSSTPIRDAVNRLHQDGLIVEVTKTGAKVIDLDANTFEEVNELLGTISSAAVKFAFIRGNKEELIQNLKETLENQKLHLLDNEYYNYDYEFHKLFFDYAKNETFKKLYKSYRPLQELLTHYAFDIGYDRGTSIKQHREIINMFEKGDIESAMKIMDEHLTDANKIHRQILERGK